MNITNIYYCYLIILKGLTDLINSLNNYILNVDLYDC